MRPAPASGSSRASAKVVKQQRQFGAAKHHGIAALIFHSSNDLLMKRDRIGFENTSNQLLHDDAIDFVAFGTARTQVLKTTGLEFFGIDIAVDEPSRPGQAETFEPAFDGFCRDDLGDMQPRQR